MKQNQPSFGLSWPRSAVFAPLGAVALLISPGQAAAQFTELDPGLPKPPFPCVAWGDYDGDGKLDVLVAGAGRRDVAFATIYQNASGVFIDSGISLLGLSRALAAWGDFDGDGDLDLAMTGLTSDGIPTTRVYRNNGGSFAVVPGGFTGVFAGNVAWGDYDGDGDLDLLVTGVTSANPGAQAATRLYRNDGGVFTSVAHPFPDCYLGAVAWGDYDRDGKLDVLITGTDSTGALLAGLWHNDGGTFTDAKANLPGMDLGFTAWGDYDNDGDLDLLFGGNSNDGWITRLYRNDGGTFTNADAGLLGLLWSSAAWGDYDNDGDLDIMLIGYDAVAQVKRSILYRNDGSGFTDSGAAFHNVFLGAVSWVDYDNDGDLDLLLAGNDNGLDILSIYRNDQATPNTPPNPPTNLAVKVSGTSAEFFWTASVDAQTPTAGLSYNLRLGTTPGGSEIVSPQSSRAGDRRLCALGNAGNSLAAQVGSLKPGTNYFWSVQAIDTAFAGSPFAEEGTFTAMAGPPAAQSIAREGIGSIRAIWRGTPGSAYQVQVTTNLSVWSLFATPTADANGLFEVVDTPGPIPAKFYRAARP
ncbi:MAG TPA: FG-GAP-like repeat-containing protein [Verrucomicrobiae bacterium]|nr:FG-GAP-like repeat-containing protein [Verrucomicrobiae bacterium]